MRVLVLHNNNLPSFLLWDKEEKDISFVSKVISLPQTDIPDFDSFVCETLAFLKEEVYDAIILPYNTTNNPIEYTGLRIVAHLRLTSQWNCLTTPILLLGPDTSSEILQFCEFGSIIGSFNIFTMTINTEVAVVKMLKWIESCHSNDKTITTESFEYQDFLSRMKNLSAPANYSTHHSLANEWAIMRWNEMITMPVTLPNHEFENMLYYKYLRVLYSFSQNMKKWKKEHKNIETIENIPKGKKLVLIDDEWEKGWSQIISHIAESSGFSFTSCEIKKEWDRDEMINQVKHFIDNTDSDCYLLDLRLHDTDFDSDYLKREKKKLSGYAILDYIKQNNIANPVVIFSASNKVWNFKNTVFKEENVINYVLKETPESALSAEESYLLFIDFVNALRTCFVLSDLKLFANKQKELSVFYPDIKSLNETIHLLLLDKNEKNNSIYKACLMNLMTFLEEYIKDRYQLQIKGEGSTRSLILVEKNKKNNIVGDVTGHVFVSRELKSDSKYPIITGSYYTATSTEAISTFSELEDNDFGVLLSVLYIKYGVNPSCINNHFIPLKNLRNKVSHESGKVDISYQAFFDFYFKIIVPIIEQDYKLSNQ